MWPPLVNASVSQFNQMRAIRITSASQLETLLDSVSEDTVTAAIHWRLCKDLLASVNDFVRELNQSPAFWSLTMNAHREVVLFRLGRLYDQQNRALCLTSLVSTISANVHFFEVDHFRERLKDNPFVASLAASVRPPDIATLTVDSEAVSESDPLVKKLITLRNRVIAHRDPTVVLGASQSPPGDLSEVEIDSLLERAATTVNRYSSLFKANTHSMRILGHDDFRRVLGHVKDGLNARAAAIEAEIERATTVGNMTDELPSVSKEDWWALLSQSADAISQFKGNQWSVTNYSLILLGAITGTGTLLESSLGSIERLALAVAAVVVAGVSCAAVWHLELGIRAARARSHLINT